MPSVLANFAPLALLLPFGGAIDAPVPTAGAELGDWARPQASEYQVRIEQRVTVRIVPQSRVSRQSLMAEIPQPPQPTRFEERKIGKCVAIDNIAGVQTGSGDRLVLYLRDRRMVSARLEKACRSRDFYSGFYLERNKDGMLCVDRDKLQSRAGANCELNRLRELVPASD